MANILYWALRTFLWLLMVTTLYFAILLADDRLWLEIPLALLVVVIYILLDQPLRDMRGRRRVR